MSAENRIGAPGRGWAWGGVAALGLLLLMSAGFVHHSAVLGWAGLTRDLSGESRLHWPDAPLASAAIFVHMIGGAAITVLAPVQLAGPVRRRWPGVHRWSGRVLVVCATLIGVAGLTYMAAKGTVGGAPLTAAFSLYGAALIVAAIEAPRHARARRLDRHRRWALRLAVLALGSWIYRLHYGLWVAATGGAGVREDFTGAFDLANLWAFYLPYLLALEVLFLIERRRGGRAPAPVG